MSLELYLAYVAACVALVILPGPFVTLVVANGLRHGTRAALWNVGGGVAGLILVLAIVAVGLSTLMASMGHWFEWLRLAGAVYLVWLGIALFRSSSAASTKSPATPRGGFFLQGILIQISNPKTLLFFGAFIPQFVDTAHDRGPQIVLLGATFAIIAALSDGAYAVFAGRAGRLLSAKRLRLASRLSGTVMIGGGLWLALSRAK